MKAAITKFRGQYRFLSNFFPVTVLFDGHDYPSVEHAYQAAKTLIRAQRYRIMTLSTAGDAKLAGRKVTMRPDWDEIKLDVMLALIRSKFWQPYMKTKLLATGDNDLIEGNYWHDNFWGVCNCGCGTGKAINTTNNNHLGKILMKVRLELRGITG